MTTQYTHDVLLVRIYKTENFPPRVLDHRITEPLVDEDNVSFHIDQSTFGCLFLLLNSPGAMNMGLTNIHGPEDKTIWSMCLETCYQIDDFFGFDVQNSDGKVLHVEIHCDFDKPPINDPE